MPGLYAEKKKKLFLNWIFHVLNFIFLKKGEKGSRGDNGSSGKDGLQGQKGQQGPKGMPGICDAKVFAS